MRNSLQETNHTDERIGPFLTSGPPRIRNPYHPTDRANMTQDQETRQTQVKGLPRTLKMLLLTTLKFHLLE